MKKRMNIIFFALCFLAALFAELYCILNADLFSTVGFGLVALITGYLFMDSARSCIINRSKSLQYDLERVLSEENKQWSDRYTQITNLQKATYTAAKKNSAELSEQIGEIGTRLEAIEDNNRADLQKFTELQKMSMEGQKNALKMQLHYDRENTKQLINVLNDKINHNDMENQLSDILNLLDDNNKLLEKYLTETDQAVYHENETDHVEKYSEGKLQDTGKALNEEAAVAQEAQAESSSINVSPLYDDPNKELTTEEIAALFASAGK